MLGMHGTRVANWAMDEADLIVAIGARFDDRVTGALDDFAPHAKIVHIDIDATEIGKNVPVHIPIVGDAKLALEALLRQLEKLGPTTARLRRVVGPDRRLAAPPHPAREPEPADGCVAPETALDALAARLGDAIVTTDVGQHQMWAANRLAFDAPAALDHLGRARHDGLRPAGRARRPGRAARATVVCVSGEGSFLMNVQELATAVEEDLPVKILLLDNASLGMVRQQQDLFWGGRRTRGRPWRLAGLGAAGPRVRRRRALDRRPGRRRGRPGRDAGRGRPGAAARPDRAGGQLPADVPARRRRAGNDRITVP